MPANAKQPYKFDNMTHYINPAIIIATMSTLTAYKEKNPSVELPMYECCKAEPEQERWKYVRAAQRLKWNVVRSRGHVYENGKLLW